jgi:hypothetical protein
MIPEADPVRPTYFSAALGTIGDGLSRTQIQRIYLWVPTRPLGFELRDNGQFGLGA